jgi:hypothetical protein
MVPGLISLFAKGDRGQKNAQAAQMVVDTFTKAVPGAINAQDAIEKAHADPAVASAAVAKVMSDPAVLALVEVGGGVKDARAYDTQWATAPSPFYKSSPVFWISILLLPMVYWFVGSLIVGGVSIPPDWPAWVQLPLKLFGNLWTGESRAGGFNLVVGIVLGGICGVYYGVSVTQNNQRRNSDQPQQNQ